MKNNLSDNIKKLRKDNNLSQEDLADKLGVSRQSISKWEQGDAYPEMDKLMQMAELFNVSLDNLVHSNISEVKTKDNNKNTIDRWIKEVSSFITDTVNLFIRMDLVSKVKFIFEELIIIFLLGLTFTILGEVGASVISNLYALPGYKYLYILLETIYEAFSFVIAAVVVIHIYKVRYLDYYRSTLNKKEEESTKEEKEVKVKEESEVKEEIIKPKEDRIIIRDAKTSEFGFFKVISTIFILFLKIMAFNIMIPIAISLVGLAISFGLSVLIINSGSFYVGLVVTILSSIVSLAVILMALINFIFNKKVQGILFVISIITFGLGIGITTASLTSFEMIDLKAAEIENDGVKISMSDKLYIANDYNVTYVEEDRKDIKVTPVDGTCNVNYSIRKDGGVFLTQECIVIDKIKFIIKEINNKRIYTDESYYDRSYVVYASKKNIEKIKKNTNDFYNKKIKGIKD